MEARYKCKTRLEQELKYAIPIQFQITANDLPKQMVASAVVPFNDSFFIVGGANAYGDEGSEFYRDNYQYDGDNDEWIEMEAKLKTPRYDHVALLVKQSLFPDCA